MGGTLCILTKQEALAALLIVVIAYMNNAAPQIVVIA
jgi:hypothetical protein